MQKVNNTIQRRVILEELRRLKSHPTADELFRLVRIRLPKISLGTVYRNLALLEEHGLIRSLTVGRLTRFDGELSVHSHLCCESCGAVEDFLPDFSAEAEAALASVLRGRVRGYRIEYTGFCRSCAEQKAGNNV